MQTACEVARETARLRHNAQFIVLWVGTTCVEGGSCRCGAEFERCLVTFSVSQRHRKLSESVEERKFTDEDGALAGWWSSRLRVD